MQSVRPILCPTLHWPYLRLDGHQVMQPFRCEWCITVGIGFYVKGTSQIMPTMALACCQVWLSQCPLLEVGQRVLFLVQLEHSMQIGQARLYLLICGEGFPLYHGNQSVWATLRHSAYPGGQVRTQHLSARPDQHNCEKGQHVGYCISKMRWGCQLAKDACVGTLMAPGSCCG